MLLLCMAALMPVFSQDTTSLLPLAIEDPQMDAYLSNRNPATLTIRLLNSPANLGKTDVKCSLVTFGPDFQTTRHEQIGTTREITLTLEDNLPYQQIWLTVGNYLYAGIYVNTELTVSIDLDLVKEKVYMIGKGIRYAGRDGELNTVMNEYVLFRREERHALSQGIDSLKRIKRELTEAVFLTQIDSIRSQMDEINAAFIAKHPRFGWAVTNEVNSEFYGKMCTVYWGDKLPEKLAKQMDQHRPFFTSNEGVLFYKYFTTYTVYRKDFPSPRVHEALMTNYAKYNDDQRAVLDTISKLEKLRVEEQKEKMQSMNALYKKRSEVFFEDIQKIKILHHMAIIDSAFHGTRADILKLCLMDMGKNAFSLTYSILLKGTRTNWCKSVVEKELSQSLATQKQINVLLNSGGAIANPEAVFGRPVTSLPFGANLYRLDTLDDAGLFIRGLQSRFKDKALIVDFWATWCAPCLAAMPYSKKLHEENGDLPVEYIYLCTSSSSNETLWKNKVAELEIPGTHIFIADKIVSELKKTLDASGGFPAYVLIDNRGKIHPKRINGIGEVDRDVLMELVGR